MEAYSAPGIVQQQREEGSEADKPNGVRRKTGEIEIKTTPGVGSLGKFKCETDINVKSLTDSIPL